MAEVGRHLWKLSSSSPSSKQSQLEQVAQVIASWVLSISQYGGSVTSLGNMSQCLMTLTIKKISFHLDGIPFISVTSWPVTGITEKILALTSLLTLMKVFIHTDKTHPSLLFSGLSSPSSCRVKQAEWELRTPEISSGTETFEQIRVKFCAVSLE